MIALVILCLFAGYLALSIWVVFRVRRWARGAGEPPGRWGWAAAIAMYLLVFWDWIPTVLLHSYYCDKEAGFFVNQTLEDWKRANPGDAEQLHESKAVTPVRLDDFVRAYQVNERFVYAVAYAEPISHLAILRAEKIVIDKKTGKELARLIDFSRGHPNAIMLGARSLSEYKFWLARPSCVAPKGVKVGEKPRETFVTRFNEFLRTAESIGEGSRHDVNR